MLHIDRGLPPRKRRIVTDEDTRSTGIVTIDPKKIKLIQLATRNEGRYVSNEEILHRLKQTPFIRLDGGIGRTLLADQSQMILIDAITKVMITADNDHSPVIQFYGNIEMGLGGYRSIFSLSWGGRVDLTPYTREWWHWMCLDDSMTQGEWDTKEKNDNRFAAVLDS